MLDDKQPEKAKVELLNLYQTFFLIDAMADPRSLAFACLVKSIDGEPRDGVTDDVIKRTAAQLDEWITKSERDGKGKNGEDNIIDSIKKKIETELAYYFPEHTDTNGELLALMRREIEIRLKRITDNEDLEQKHPELERVRRRMRDINYDNTRLYLDYEKESDVSFEQGCLAITGELHKDAKQMTVMEYHAAMKLLDERAKEMEKARSKNH
jgi:uncharacterized membrane-anchored protein